MIRAALLSSISQVISRAALLDAETQQHLTKLDGRCFCFEFTLPIRVRIYVTITQQGVMLNLDAPEKDPDATFVGSAVAFLRVATSDAMVQTVGIKMDGNTGQAELLFRWVKNLKIDWEELIAKHVGDELSYIVSTPINMLFGWKKNTALDFSQTVSEYLKHEAALLPSTPEVGYFMASVDELSASAGRLQARITRLEKL